MNDGDENKTSDTKQPKRKGQTMILQAGVQFTGEYNVFRFHEHNRVLRDPKTGQSLVRKDLLASMRAEGYRPEEPITAYANDDQSFTIIDGHNRLVAAQQLGIEVAFIAYPRNGKAQWTPIKSSRTKRQWTMREIAQAYAQEGKEDYAEVLAYCDRTGIKLQQAASMMYGQAAHSGNANKSVRSGAFIIKDRLRADIVADISKAASAFIDWATDDRFIAALSCLTFVDGFSATHLKEKISRYPEYLIKPKDRDAAVDMLDALYNRFCKTRLEIAFEVKKAMRERSRRINNSK